MALEKVCVPPSGAAASLVSLEENGIPELCHAALAEVEEICIAGCELRVLSCEFLDHAYSEA